MAGCSASGVTGKSSELVKLQKARRRSTFKASSPAQPTLLRLKPKRTVQRQKKPAQKKRFKTKDGYSTNEEALQFLANTLTNKLLHAPSAQLRAAGSNGQTQLLEAASALFQLNPDRPPR